MITAIELENARLFEGGGWRFDLSPLTVLCGTNSAGKSTVLRPSCCYARRLEFAKCMAPKADLDLSVVRLIWEITGHSYLTTKFIATCRSV